MFARVTMGPRIKGGFVGNFFNNLNSKLQTFMVGRNGSDRLSRWALGVAIVFLIINMFMPNVICSVLSYIFLFYSIFRIFSGNVPAREEEEAKFDAFLERIKPGGRKAKNSNFTTRQNTNSKPTESDKTTFECEECGQSLSVPKGRGTLKITCPKCHHQQIVKS